MLDTIEELMEDVRRVTDNLAHDLRTPLTRLRNRLENLKSDNDADKSSIEAALADADGLLDTFNALLRIASIESGRRRAAFKSIPLDDVVRDVTELYEPLAEQKQQKLDVSVSDDVRIQGDRDLLFQAFANLLDNAIRLTPGGGLVTLVASEDSDHVIVSVSDTGPGIAPELLGRLFDRFSQLDGKSSGAAGLGLAIVRGFVEAHGGMVEAESSPGQGTTFTVKLPAS